MQFTYRHFISAFDETEQMHLFAGWERTYISAVHILLPYGPFKVKHATERTKINRQTVEMLPDLLRQTYVLLTKATRNNKEQKLNVVTNKNILV